MRTRARMVLTFLLSSLLLNTGCTEMARAGIWLFETGAAVGEARSKTEAAESGPVDPNVTANVQGYYGTDGMRSLGLRVLVNHPYDYTLEGVRVRWRMYDDKGKLIQGKTLRVPPIPPGETVTVVDHSRSPMRRETPNRPVLDVVNSGRPTEAAPRQFAVRDTQFTPKMHSMSCGSRGSSTCTSTSYTTTVTFTTDDRPVDAKNVFVGIIAKDKDGKAISFAQEHVAYLKTIEPNTTVEIRPLDFYTYGIPASMEAFVWVAES